VQTIFDGLTWLGVHWDDEPIFQFPRAARHAEVAHEMLANGKAYKCFATAEELTAMREEQKAKGLPQRYDGRWRDRAASDAPPGAPYVIRLRAPLDGETTLHDLVQGDVTVQNSQLDDMVLLRSDGTPTYMLAVVVDDHDMNITHVIRGDDHLTNTFRHIQIYNAMGWKIPEHAHLPLILGPDGHKLSKRHGAVGTAQYRDDGYLAIAMRNYLLRLGWSHGDQEFFTDEEAIKLFDIKDVGRSPARFDFAKLGNINNHYMRAMPVAELAVMLKKPLTLSDGSWLAAVDLFRERAKTLVELQQAIDNLASAHIAPVADEARPHLAAIADKLSGDAAAIDQMLKDYVASSGIPFKLIGQNIRIALTGEANAPAIGKLIEILGAEESVRRIMRAVK
jgi:glutamyl-tRNA synthetase